MTTPHRPLFLIMLATVLIVCLISIATSGTVRNRLNFAQDCMQDCAQRRDKMIETCNQLTGDARESCRGAASSQYDRCAEGCKGGTQGGGNQGGDMGGNGGKKPE